MEQRRLRLGDILDDYCPRERRLANHVVVAMVGDEVKQTRCTTCDAEHPYKGARVPPRRKPKAAPGVVAETAPDRPRLNGDLGALTEPAPIQDLSSAPAPDPAQSPAPEPLPQAAAPQEPDEALEDGPVHRPLIRATLPRIEGEVKERPIPEFTMRMARPAGRPHRSGGARQAHGGKGGGGRHARQAANFRPGVMSSWSPSNPRPRGGDPQQAGRPQQHQRPRGGNKKSR